MTDGPAAFSETTSVINDGNILLSSTALGATDVSALVSFSLPGDFSRLTNGKIAVHFPYVYEYVGSQITIVRGSIFVTSVTVLQGNGPIAVSF